MEYLKNPLDTISDSDFEEFLIAVKYHFFIVTENGVVTKDYLKWYDTYHKLQWYAVKNFEKIFAERNIVLTTTLQIVDLLISERKNKK